MTLDDSTVDPDIIGPDGEVIRPDRIVSIDIGDDLAPEGAPNRRRRPGRSGLGRPRGHARSVTSCPGSSQVTRSAYGDALMIGSAASRPCWKCDHPS